MVDNDNLCFQKRKVAFANVLIRPKPEDIQFTVLEEDTRKYSLLRRCEV